MKLRTGVLSFHVFKQTMQKPKAYNLVYTIAAVLLTTLPQGKLSKILKLFETLREFVSQNEQL